MAMMMKWIVSNSFRIAFDAAIARMIQKDGTNHFHGFDLQDHGVIGDQLQQM